MTTSKTTYYWRRDASDGTWEWIVADRAKEIEIDPMIRTFIFKLNDLWNVSELTTGTNIAFGSKKADAITRATEILQWKGGPATLDAISKQRERCGLSPAVDIF